MPVSASLASLLQRVQGEGVRAGKQCLPAVQRRLQCLQGTYRVYSSISTIERRMCNNTASLTCPAARRVHRSQHGEDWASLQPEGGLRPEASNHAWSPGCIHTRAGACELIVDLSWQQVKKQALQNHPPRCWFISITFTHPIYNNTSPSNQIAPTRISAADQNCCAFFLGCL